MTKLRLAVVAFLLLTATAFAQTAPQRTIVVPGRVLDVKTGHYLTGQAITIEGDRIVSIGPAGPTSTGTRVITLPSLTILPGLIEIGRASCRERVYVLV